MKLNGNWSLLYLICINLTREEDVKFLTQDGLTVLRFVLCFVDYKCPTRKPASHQWFGWIITYNWFCSTFKKTISCNLKTLDKVHFIKKKKWPDSCSPFVTHSFAVDHHHHSRADIDQLTTSWQVWEVFFVCSLLKRCERNEVFSSFIFESNIKIWSQTDPCSCLWFQKDYCTNTWGHCAG